MATLRMREALRDAMAEEMRRDEAVFVMGEDVGVFQGAFKVTEGLLDRFGEKRVRDTPISENSMIGAGVGAGGTAASGRTGAEPGVPSRNDRMSCLVTRPAVPVPDSCETSTL